MSLIDELKRRKVFKVGAAYLVVGWVLIQVSSTIAPQLNLPEWAPRLITLVILLGFPIALVLAWVFDVTHEGIKVDAAPIGNKRVFAIAAILAAIAIGWYWKERPIAVIAEADAHSIAVLPFLDMSQAKDQEYFSDGLSEELLNLLAQLPQLRVIARTSSFSFKGKEADVATIAKTLNVGNILEGSVRKSGNTLRITAQLIRTTDSSHLWSQTYDRELTDIFKVQDEIASAVVAALKVKLLPTQELTNPFRSSNTDAYNQYLLGGQFNTRGTVEGYRRAIDAFRQAVALDPGYAAGYAGLSFAEGSFADRTGDDARRHQSLADADKAIALAPEFVGGYAARGVARLNIKWDWVGARADFEKALALNAGTSNVQVLYSRLMVALGLLPEALASARKATDLDPLSPAAWSQLGRYLNASGQFGPARIALNRSLEISPEADYPRFHLGETDLLEGKPQQALDICHQSNDVNSYVSSCAAMAEYSLGSAKQSQETLDRVIAQDAQSAAYQIAEVYAWRGEKDKAFEWLDRAYNQNDAGLTFIKADPLIANLYSDPRYSAMLKKLGLPE